MLHRERLVPPISWWLLLGVAVVSAGAAAGTYLGPAWAVGAAVGCLLIFGGLLLSASLVVRVDATALRVGRAWIEHRYLADCHVLDRAAVVRRTGPDADARAYLVTRPYVATAVEVRLADPDDPAPYWLISSRRPEELCAALRRVRSARVAE